MTNDTDILNSPVSRTVSRSRTTLDVEIYRRASDHAWRLRIVNQTGTTIHWAEDFETDEEALKAFEADLERDGIESYDDDAPCPMCRR